MPSQPPMLQVYSLVALLVMLPAMCWQIHSAYFYFRRLLDRATFEQLMVTPLGSVAVLKDTLLHLSLQGVPAYVAALLGYLAVFPLGFFALFDISLYFLFAILASGGPAIGVSLALRVPLTDQERAERRARLCAVLHQKAINFGRFCVQFGRFSARVLLPLAAIAGVGWVIGVTVHPALGWLVAMLGGMAFIVTLLIIATARQIGTPMPPLPPLPEPGFKDLWEDRLRRYFDREAAV